MSDYKRMTYKNSKGEWAVNRTSDCNVSTVCNADIETYYIGEPIDRLAELEDKIENGELVKAIFQPKYDENETVYIIDRVNDKYWSVPDGRYVVRKCFVVMVTKYAGYRYHVQPYDLPQELLDDATLHNEYWERGFSEKYRAWLALDTLYPTKEVAEARLKELQEKKK